MLDLVQRQALARCAVRAETARRLAPEGDQK
jgi:hypothetical protein